MKNIKNYLVLVLFFPLLIAAQDTLNYPLDVVFNEDEEIYYVSNWADGDGYISIVNTLGEITGTLFSDLTYAGGMCLIDNILYVVDNSDLYNGSLPSYIVAIDINTGAELSRLEVSTGGTWLDLMTTDNNGHLFVCDSEKLRIYKIDIASESVSAFVEGVNKPFGICYDHINDRIIFTASKSTVSYLRSIHPDGGEITGEFYFEGWIEGVVMAETGEFFISSWTGNGIAWGNEPVFKLNQELNWKYELTNDQNRPFGMCLGHDNNLVICNWGGHFVNFFDLTPFGTNETDALKKSLKVYPNPGNGYFNIRIPVIESKDASLSVLDLNGNIITSKIISKSEAGIEQSLDLTFLPAGIYVLVINGNNRIYREKLIIN